MNNRNIGDRIKKLRRKKDITQEKFAEYMGVSPQAVSRWENGAAYPDILTIPAIASFFHVSTDFLLGVEEERREAAVSEYLAEYKKLCSLGEKEKRFALIKEAKKQFPGDFRILISYVRELASSPYQGLDSTLILSQEELTRCWEEVISVCRNIIEDCPIDQIRYDAIYLLSTTYSESGDMENAVKTAQLLPSFDDTQNMILYCLYDYDTDEHIQFHQESLWSLTENLWLWIRSAAWGQKKPEDKIFLFKKAIAIIELLFEDSDFGYMHQALEQFYEHTAIVCLEMGDTEAALDALEEYVRHRIAFMKLPDEFHYTSRLFNHLTLKMDSLTKNYSCSDAEIALHFLEKTKYDPIRDTERFRALQEQLEALK